jgi:drug/metabolite transporter superfamily protein YnfA
MRKVDFAESILLLTTTPERAASTAGDLAEESTQRGTLWFWTSLLRTTASLIWRAWTAEPRRIMALALKACLMQIGIFIGVAVCAIIGGVAATIALGVKVGPNPQNGILLIIAGIGVLASDFLIGRWIARRAPGREFAAWIGYMVVATLFWRVLANPNPQPMAGVPAIADPLLAIAEILTFFAGVNRVRRTSRLTSQ